MESTKHDGHLVQLDAEHPGFRDQGYRQRRDQIAHMARAYAPSRPAPRVEYTAAEGQVWDTVCTKLRPLHERLVHPELLRYDAELGLTHGRLPQFQAVNEELARETGFRLEPVAGLVNPRVFLEALSEGRFLATQYVRHPSHPLYTPEPDVIHELIGHAASLLHPDISDLSRRFGAAARVANDARIDGIIRVYWWVLEFGLVEYDGTPRAVGAGLLSSVAELEGFGTGPELRPMQPRAMAATPFDPTSINECLFVAPSWDDMRATIEAWLADGR